MGSTVHCQCSNMLGGTGLSDSYCAGDGDGNGNLWSAHSHCVGPYEMDGWFFGDANVGSVYYAEHPAESKPERGAHSGADSAPD